MNGNRIGRWGVVNYKTLYIYIQAVRDSGDFLSEKIINRKGGLNRSVLFEILYD